MKWGHLKHIWPPPTASRVLRFAEQPGAMPSGFWNHGEIHAGLPSFRPVGPVGAEFRPGRAGGPVGRTSNRETRPRRGASWATWAETTAYPSRPSRKVATEHILPADPPRPTELDVRQLAGVHQAVDLAAADGQRTCYLAARWCGIGSCRSLDRRYGRQFANCVSRGGGSDRRRLGGPSSVREIGGLMTHLVPHDFLRHRSVKVRRSATS